MPGSETTDPRLRCVLPFEAAPAEVRLLRRAAASQLGRWGLAQCVEDVELLVTELATNVVKHVGAGTSATLTLEWVRDRLRLEVHDRSSVLPLFETPSYEKEHGRGLPLIASVAVAFGTDLTAVGKAVWCEVPVIVGAGCHRLERAAAVLEQFERVGAMRGGRARRTGMEESAIELIADLLHCVAAQGCDPDDILDRAQMHYEAEVEAA